MAVDPLHKSQCASHSAKQTPISKVDCPPSEPTVSAPLAADTRLRSDDELVLAFVLAARFLN